MQAVAKSARAKVLTANISFKLWAKSINTIIYIKNCSPKSAIYKSTFTPIQDFYRGHPPKVDDIRIFGSETYVFDETSTRVDVISKT